MKRRMFESKKNYILRLEQEIRDLELEQKTIEIYEPILRKTIVVPSYGRIRSFLKNKAELNIKFMTTIVNLAESVTPSNISDAEIRLNREVEYFKEKLNGIIKESQMFLGEL